MHTPVSVEDKKSFIRWFLNHYQLKKRESVWILNYLMNHDEILHHLHFVREAKFCPRGIIMTSQCSSETAFRFYKNQLVTTDAEKSFHDIRLNKTEALYLQLNFKRSYRSALYIAVLEENPFIPNDYFITAQDKEVAQQLLDQSRYEFQKSFLNEQIDQALDSMNEEAFLKLTKELQMLEENFLNQPKLLKR
ncbi:ReoY family proteolytic degradation factor [Virgibacillus sp. Bac330]|uniref:ReoY family proteolytic degradation factor n=1 Tax=Virgibacillus sp. Bac330 TaxID=2419841 RepID=UPI000EF4E22F|nr:ReoY family proteolytic degradation factor [Virgibacillus sp. Bac330]